MCVTFFAELLAHSCIGSYRQAQDAVLSLHKRPEQVVHSYCFSHDSLDPFIWFVNEKRKACAEYD